MASADVAGNILDEMICEICHKKSRDWVTLCKSCEAGKAGSSQDSGSKQGMKRRREEEPPPTPLFCEEHEEANCLRCEKSQAHGSQSMLDAKEAAQKCKAKLLNILSHLQEKEKSPEWKDVQSALSRIKGKDVYDPPDLQDIPQGARADVTLDPGTANPRLLVSADHKSVEWNVERTENPPSGKRFELEPCVLGSEGFTSGTHYWEVDLGDGGAWAVGVARESVKRGDWISLKPQEGFWALEQWGGQLWALTTPKQPLFPRGSPRKVGVYLDYDAGRVVFYNAETREWLCCSPPSPFNGEKIFPFFWVSAKLLLCPGDVGGEKKAQPMGAVRPRTKC